MTIDLGAEDSRQRLKRTAEAKLLRALKARVRVSALIQMTAGSHCEV